MALAQGNSRDLVDHGAIHRKRDLVGLHADLVVVPLARRLDAVFLHLLHEIETLQGALHQIDAKQIAACGTGLRLGPQLTPRREPDADAAVVLDVGALDRNAARPPPPDCRQTDSRLWDRSAPGSTTHPTARAGCRCRCCT